MPQLPISLPYWSQISFPGAFFWALQALRSRWGSDMENMVGVEVIQSAIHRDLWHGVLSGWKSTFFFFICGCFWWFLPSNAPIMQYNIRYCWFFFSQGNQWRKYLAHPKIRRTKHCLLMFVSLVAFTCCCSSLIWQLISLQSKEVDPCFIHCPIFLQKLLFVVLKQLQTMHWIVDALLFLIDCEQMRHPL